MPRYFFNTRIGQQLILDPEGQELRDPDHAWNVARTTIREILKTEGGQAGLLNAILEVTDDDGEIVLEFPFTEAILDGSESVAGDGAGDGAAGLATALAFRLKLALTTGFAPELGTCARCGEGDGLAGFSGAAGGVVCDACGGFDFSGEAHGFMVEALGRPLAQAPAASPRALRQAERAIGETLEHHAHVQLRAAA